jgi:hypothetical protein
MRRIKLPDKDEKSWFRVLKRRSCWVNEMVANATRLNQFRLKAVIFFVILLG